MITSILPGKAAIDIIIGTGAACYLINGVAHHIIIYTAILNGNNPCTSRQNRSRLPIAIRSHVVQKAIIIARRVGNR